MSDAPAPVRCDGCDTLGRRPLGHPAPHHWFYLESENRTRGEKPGVFYTVYACSEACRDKLWQRGPGPNVVDETGSERMRDRLERKNADG